MQLKMCELLGRCRTAASGMPLAGEAPLSYLDALEVGERVHLGNYLPTCKYLHDLRCKVGTCFIQSYS